MQIPLSHHLSDVGLLAYGCMGLGGRWEHPSYTKQERQQAFTAIDAALEQGIRLFDHADIYKHGRAEQVFGEYLQANPQLRSSIYLQTKCGIRMADPEHVGRYDFSAGYIRQQVDASLQRLQTDYIDILVLHRPDPLMDPHEVAQVFDQLHQSGKVRYFGVSNFGWPQLQWLQQHCTKPLVVNQLQMSLADHAFIEQNVLTGMPEGSKHFFGYGTAEFCLQQGVQLQAWGSLAQGRFSGCAQTAHEHKVSAVVAQIAALYGVSAEAILLAWLRRLPLQIQPVIGTTDPRRIAQSCAARHLMLNREHWYQLWVDARGQALP